MSDNLNTGAQFLARGAVEAGVSLVTGYPGSPSTAVATALRDMTTAEQLRIEWTTNEKVALEMAFGASVGGKRVLLCVKSVGLNIALDPLMVINLSGCNAGLVILAGDDPGSWGSQNEQDSRSLGLAANIPILEPTSPAEAERAVLTAFQLSEETNLPFMVRFTRALAQAEEKLSPSPDWPSIGDPPAYERESMRWVVLPINAIPLAQRLLDRINSIEKRFETSPLNRIVGTGRQGILAAGYAAQKLSDALADHPPDHLQILQLGTFNPLPRSGLIDFMCNVDSVLVLEETAPLLERALRDIAQTARMTLPIYGRDSGHVAPVGELLSTQISQTLNAIGYRFLETVPDRDARPRPSRDPLCKDCPYWPTLDSLTTVMEEKGGRNAFIVVGEPGCMVRSQLSPLEMLDVKNSLGSSIGMAAGLALANTGKSLISLVGDSAFLHSGLNGLIDAVRVGAHILVIILDNGTTALSGGQPNPASRSDFRGLPRQSVKLEVLAHSTGVEWVRVADLDQGDAIAPFIRDGIDFQGTAVLIARGKCPRHLSAAQRSPRAIKDSIHQIGE